MECRLSEQLVTVEIDDHIAVVTLNRPDALNAISGAMAGSVRDAFAEVSRNTDVWVVVLAATGDKAFCVGADLKERATFDLDDFSENRKQVRSMFEAIRKTPQPVIASIFGFALGGGFELVLSCDLAIAAEGTMMGLPEARVGLLPAGGGTQLLTRKVGTARAKDLIFRGRRMDVSEAKQLGLVTEITSREELADRTMGLARDLCRSSPIAVREAKRAIDAALGVDLDAGIEIEHRSWEVVIRSEDRAEGIAAFNEKRDAEWKNR